MQITPPGVENISKSSFQMEMRFKSFWIDFQKVIFSTFLSPLPPLSGGSEGIKKSKSSF